MDSKHTLIFIHGMGDTHPVKGFETLWKGIGERYDAVPGRKEGAFGRRYTACFVDWHEVTAEAKRAVFDLAFEGRKPRESFLDAALHPGDFGRTFFTFFLGDVVAYVDENPNNIRETIWHLMKGGLIAGGPYSIVAHSLGSVIAFDFLFHLFVEGVLFDPVQDDAVSIEDLQQRFRGLYTMGSPVGLFMLRKGSLWRRAEHGHPEAKPFSNIVNPIPEDALWCNYWDQQDLVAYPLARLFASNPANARRPLRDIEVGTGPDPISAHIRYWSDSEVAGEIAATLK